MDTTNELIFISTTKLAGLLRERKLSAVEAVQMYMKRQTAVNDKLNAVITHCFDRAIDEARALDAKAAKNDFVGPLHGVPMTIKDSFDTAGVISTGATFGRQHFVPAKDATVVARLRKAGAILLGKTNTLEFTLGGLSGVNTTSNLLCGSSHNPYDLTRSTAASSGGAGAIVAAGAASFDIGSDWGGSIRLPSHNNGIAGVKPTSVRVPRTGHIIGYGGVFDLWQQIGPMSRRVEDLALITPIISGPDFSDAACAPVPWNDPAKVDLKKLRVAFCVDNGGLDQAATDDDTKNTIRAAAKWLDGIAMSVTEHMPLEVLTELYAAQQKLIVGDAWQFYGRLVEKWGTKNFSPCVRDFMSTLTPISTAQYVQAWEKQDECKSRMLAWMSKHDVLLCPVAPKPAQPIDEVHGTLEVCALDGGWHYTTVFNGTGWPVAVVRCGSSTDGKLPIGVQIVAAPWREDIALAVASFLESKSGGWKTPPI